MEYLNTLSQNISNFIEAHPFVILALILWTLPWKIAAVWKAARLYHQYWFVALLIINSFGILEIFYIFAIARKAEKELPPVA